MDTSSAGATSPTSADLAPGTVIAGFRLDRVAAREQGATVYEATQLSLDRRVAFRLVHDRDADVRELVRAHEPGVYAAGASEHGPWLAMQLAGAGRTRAGRWLLAGAALLVVAGAAVLVLTPSDREDDGAPPVGRGAMAIGSALSAGAISSVDCNGGPPGGASPVCTIAQRDLGGRPVVAPATGTVTAWAVRGARGTFALQILRGRGDRVVEAARGPDSTVPDGGVHVIPADLPIARGDRVGLVVYPEDAVGVRSVPGATTDRWFGPVIDPPRAPERPAGSGLDRELLLRVTIRPGTPVTPLPAVRGARAEAAPSGRMLGTRDEAGRTVALVTVGSAVGLDLLDGVRRVARVPVAGADARGRLLAFRAGSGAVRVRWRNPDGATVDRRVAVSARGFG